MVLRQIFKFLLRIIAWMSTGILFLCFFTVLGLANLQSFKSEFMEAFDYALGEMVEFEQVEVSFQGISPKIQVRGLELRSSIKEGAGQLITDFLEVRFAQPLWNTKGIQIEYIGIDSPQLTGQFDLAQYLGRRKGVRTSPTSDGPWTFGVVLSSLSNVQTMEVSNGQFELQLNSPLTEKTVAGQFEMNIDPNDDVHSLLGSVLTSWHSPSSLNFRIDMSKVPSGNLSADLQLDVNSADIVWLSLFLPSTMGDQGLALDGVAAVADSSIEARWRNNRFESVGWSLKLTDPGLSASDNATELSLAGEWKLESRADFSAQTNFWIKSLNATSLLANYGVFFPPRSYAFMAPRLQSLYFPELSGRLGFDPSQLIQSKTYDLLEIDGQYTDLTFEFNQKWPPVRDGKGTINVRGKQVGINSEILYFNGIKINDATASVSDIVGPDPILTIAMSALAPAGLGLDLFGPNGQVNPGQIEGITSMRGNADVKLDIRIPLRRGKQFKLDGNLAAQNMTLVTSVGIEANDIKGAIDFNRQGATKGNIEGEILGGRFTTAFEGEETADTFTVNGSAKGMGRISALESLLGEKIAARMNGDISWNADYSWTKGLSTITLSTSLAGLEARLPLPLVKEADAEMPLKVSIETKDKSERIANFELSPLLVGRIHSKRNGQGWLIDKGAVSIGLSQLPIMPESGVSVDLYASFLDLDEWLRVLDDEAENAENAENADLNYGQSVQRVQMVVDYLLLSRKRIWSNFKAQLTRQEDYWGIQVDSDQFAGVARYRSEDFLEEGEVRSFEAELSKCHMAEAQEPLSGKPIDPSTLPRISIRCADTVYGQYHLGKSTIVAEPEHDRWAIRTADFEAPHMEVKAEGEWLHSQTTNIRFESNSSDFGETMKSLGYHGTFLNGQMEGSGTLSWNDALTNWSAEKTSGKVGLLGSDIFVQTGIDTTGLDLIGFFNYDVFFDNLSKEISEFDEEGVGFDSIVGDAEIENGVIRFPAIVFENPSVQIYANGSTNWSTKELDLSVGASPKVGKSLTLIATLINPMTGLYTYLSNELLKTLDLNLFELQYSIGGTWKNPEMILLKKEEQQTDVDKRR